MVSYLTEELVRQGHEVTLFASGDSVTSARLVPGSSAALRLDSGCIDVLAHHVVMLEKVFSAAARFDVVHFHIDYAHFPLSRRHRTPQLTTLHGRLDIPDLVPLYREFPDMPVVSISECAARAAALAQLAGHRPPRPAPGPLPLPRSAGTTWPSWAGSRPRSGWTAPSRSRAGSACPCASRPRSTASTASTTSARSCPCSTTRWSTFLGEVGEAEKAELLGGARAMLFPDRLAGALRHGHDRGHGLRHAGHRLAARLGAGGDRARGQRLRRRERGRGGRGRAPRRPPSAAAAAARPSRSASPPLAWPRTTWTFTAAC